MKCFSVFFNKLASVFPRRYTLKHGNDLCGTEGTPAFRLQNINNLYFYHRLCCRWSLAARTHPWILGWINFPDEVALKGIVCRN